MRSKGQIRPSAHVWEGEDLRVLGGCHKRAEISQGTSGCTERRLGKLVAFHKAVAKVVRIWKSQTSPPSIWANKEFGEQLVQKNVSHASVDLLRRLVM